MKKRILKASLALAMLLGSASALAQSDTPDNMLLAPQVVHCLS